MKEFLSVSNKMRHTFLIYLAFAFSLPVFSQIGSRGLNTRDLGVSVQEDLDVPSQAEAEAGVSTEERVWTAERIAQAISALAGESGFSQEEIEDFVASLFAAGTHSGASIVYDDNAASLSVEVLGAASLRGQEDLGSGTSISVNTDYFVELTSSRALTIDGTPEEGDYITVWVYVPVAPVTVTLNPSVQRIYTLGTTNTISFDVSGLNYIRLTFKGGVWKMVDSGDSEDPRDPSAVSLDEAQEFSSLPEKIAPVSADTILVEDSENGGSKVRVPYSSFLDGGGQTTIYDVEEWPETPDEGGWYFKVPTAEFRRYTSSDTFSTMQFSLTDTEPPVGVVSVDGVNWTFEFNESVGLGSSHSLANWLGNGSNVGPISFSNLSEGVGNTWTAIGSPAVAADDVTTFSLDVADDFEDKPAGNDWRPSGLSVFNQTSGLFISESIDDGLEPAGWTSLGTVSYASNYVGVSGGGSSVSIPLGNRASVGVKLRFHFDYQLSSEFELITLRNSTDDIVAGWYLDAGAISKIINEGVYEGSSLHEPIPNAWYYLWLDYNSGTGEIALAISSTDERPSSDSSSSAFLQATATSSDSVTTLVLDSRNSGRNTRYDDIQVSVAPIQ